MLDKLPEELDRLAEPDTTVRYVADPDSGQLVPHEVELFAFVYRPKGQPKVARRILEWLPSDQSIEFFFEEVEGSRDGSVFRMRRHGERWQLADDQREHGIADVNEATAIWWLNHCLPCNTGPHPRAIELHPHEGEAWSSDHSSERLEALVRDTMMKALTAEG